MFLTKLIIRKVCNLIFCHLSRPSGFFLFASFRLLFLSPLTDWYFHKILICLKRKQKGKWIIEAKSILSPQTNTRTAIKKDDKTFFIENEFQDFSMELEKILNCSSWANLFRLPSYCWRKNSKELKVSSLLSFRQLLNINDKILAWTQKN